MATLASGPLDSEVSDREVADIAQNCLKSWEELSPYVGLDEVANEALRRTPGGYVEQKKACLQEWKRQQGSRATFRALIQAAKNAKNIDFADKLEKMARKQIRGMLITFLLCTFLCGTWIHLHRSGFMMGKT